MYGARQRPLEDSLMRVPITARLVAAAAALAGCSASPPVVDRYPILTFVCDTTLQRPPRPAEIPYVSMAAGYGALTGVVFRAGTETGIDSASIMLSEDGSTQPSLRRLTGPTGGFAFDSVVPGRYRLRVQVAWEHPESSFVTIAGNRIDTVRVAMPAPGFCARR
jgi:hypothetical protein